MDISDIPIFFKEDEHPVCSNITIYKDTMAYPVTMIIKSGSDSSNKIIFHLNSLEDVKKFKESIGKWLNLMSETK